MHKSVEDIDIASILPHRFPFLFVDRILEIDLDARNIRALKCISTSEPCLQGHFPGRPIMPGVIALEALAQAAGILVWELGYHNQHSMLLSIKNAKFRQPILPGHVIHLCVQCQHIGTRGGRVLGRALIDGETLAVEAELAFAMINKHEQ